jgi:hypothetical protein
MRLAGNLDKAILLKKPIPGPFDSDDGLCFGPVPVIRVRLRFRRGSKHSASLRATSASVASFAAVCYFFLW